MPQGLCTCSSLCLECSSSRSPHGSHTHLLLVSAQTSIPKEALSDHPIHDMEPHPCQGSPILIFCFTSLHLLPSDKLCILINLFIYFSLSHSLPDMSSIRIGFLSILLISLFLVPRIVYGHSRPAMNLD